MTNIEIKEQKEAPLLHRKELTCMYTYEGKVTPPKTEVVKKISEMAKTEEALVAIKKIDPIFGERKAKVTAYIYEKSEDFKACEVINKKLRKAGEGAAPAAEKK